MVTKSEVESIVIKEIIAFSDTENFDANANLRDDLGMDSLEEVEMVMNLEKEFNVLIPDPEAEKIKTVQDTVNLFLKHVKYD
jgi:acyl carrier protein